MQSMKEVNTDFMGLIESGILVILERKHGNNTEDNVITIFKLLKFKYFLRFKFFTLIFNL